MQPSNKKLSMRATRFLSDEDELLIELKEKRSVPWNRIVRHFPGRTKGALQVRYSTKLKNRGTGSPRRDRSRRVTCPLWLDAANLNFLCPFSLGESNLQSVGSGCFEPVFS